MALPAGYQMPTTIINAISAILIAFVAISLIVAFWFYKKDYL